MNSLVKMHNTNVLEISQQMKKVYLSKKKVRIYHGTTNSTRTQKFKKDEMIDISDLNRVLEVNAVKHYAIVEPNVAMDTLVRETLLYELVPPVVMELPGITVGGGIQGGAGESSSFKWGLFHETCIEYEIVLGNGDCVVASPKKNSDLFFGTAGSYGSLGIITLIKIKLIPAKPFVKLTYHRVNNFNEAITLSEESVKSNAEFVDGILFSKTFGTIMTGIFSEKQDLPVARFSRAIDDWFYLHAKKTIKKYSQYEELIPLEDYLFRYNRGAFWVGKYAFTRSGIPFNKLTRFLFNPLFKTRTLYRFLQAINISQRQFIQDLCLPKKALLPFLKYVDTHVSLYPLWLCPGWSKNNADKLSPGYTRPGFCLDVGVWGKVKLDFPEFVKLNQDVEKLVAKMRGRKVLYAHQYYSKDEFWKIYDAQWYQALRKKYYAEDVFSDVYEKTRVKEKYDVSFFKGLWEVIKSPFALPIS